MPTQLPIPAIAESQEKILRNRGVQLKELGELGRKLAGQKFVASDGYNVSLSTVLGLLKVFDDLCSNTGAANDRQWAWHGIDEFATRAGISEKTCRRTISVLRSIGLIETVDGWVSTQHRRLQVRIDWERVLEYELAQDEEDLRLWTRRKTRQRDLFGKNVRMLSGHSDRTYVDTMTGPIRTQLPNPSICHSHINSPIHPQDGGEEGEVGSSKEEGRTSASSAVDEFTTEARRHGEEEHDCIPHSDFRRCDVENDADPVQVQKAGIELAGVRSLSVASVPRSSAVREEHREGSGRDLPHCPLPTAHCPPTIRSIATRLRRLGEGMGSPESVLRASQAAGYSVEEIDQIVTWYERQARTDAQGKTWWPYTLGQLATRLKDEQARLDGCTPAQGRWAGGKCAIWLSLGGEGQAGPGRAVGSGQDRGMVVPTKEQAALLEQQERVRSLSRRDGFELLRITAESPGELQQRAREALRWSESGGWPESALVTPKGLCRLLGEILQRDERSETREESQRGKR